MTSSRCGSTTLRAAMDRNGWPAVLVYGDVREHAALAFLSSFIPRVRWGMALLPRSGDARLLCAMSTRDLPAMRTLTWIADVRSGMGPEWDKAFDPWFDRFTGDQAQKLGTIGFDIMAPVLYAAVRRSLGERFALQRADDICRHSIAPQAAARTDDDAGVVQACSKPRQKLLSRAGAAITSRKPRRSMPSASRGRTPRRMSARWSASTAAARWCRSRAASRNAKARWSAISPSRFWAIGPICSSPSMTVPSRAAARHAEAALDAIIANMRPGARTDALHAKAVGALAPYKLHPVLGGSVGHGIGLSLHEGAEFDASDDATLVEDGVYALQVGAAEAKAGNALISAIVRVAAKGAEVLVRSKPQAG